MKKIFLSKAFGLIVLCFSLSSVATTLITKERICPLGGERFTVDVLGSYSTFGQRLDLKTLGTYGTNPFRLEVCPNGFVDYKENYSKAEFFYNLIPFNHILFVDSQKNIAINKNLNTSEKHNKNQQEENNKIKKFKFFTPGFLK